MQTAIVCGKLCTAPIGDYYVTCSFDSNHVILRSRMPYHIVKCVKNHPGHNKVQCPYDATEYIDNDKLANHLLTCESKRSLDAERYEFADLKARKCMGKNENTPYFHASAPMQDEEWSGPPENEKDTKNGFIDSSDDDDDSSEKIRSIGRGMLLNKPTLQKGMGRAALLKQIFSEYQEKQRLKNLSLLNGEVRNAVPKENIVQDQFVDA